MALPVVIPNTFANANASIPLSQLDNNFSTVAVAINGMANGAEALANVNITGGSIANASLSNVSISSGNVTINVANVTTLDATNVEVTNIKAKDGTASATIADSTGVMTIGSSVLTTVDINGGTIDGTAIGGSTPAAGAFTTLSATGNISSTSTGSVLSSSCSVVGTPSALFQNTSTDPAAHWQMGIRTGSSAAGDPSYALGITGVTNWTIGIDNSDSQKLKISNSLLVGTSTVLTLDPTGLAVTGAISSTGNLTVTGGTITTGSATELSLGRYSAPGLKLDSFSATPVNYARIYAGGAGDGVVIAADGSDAAVGLGLYSKGVDPVGIHTDGGGLGSLQVSITHTASANRYITLTGSNGGNPTIGTSAGDLAVSTNLAVTGAISASGTLSVNSNNISADNSLGFRNRIINGDMRIDQRNAGAAVTLTAGGIYTVDRWQGVENTDGDMTAQQDSSAPTGFVTSVKCTTTTADGSLASSQNVQFRQAIEGLNFADLGWGTASAKTVTISFWVRSSLTGTFGGSLRNSAVNRSYPFTYAISVADTWEYKTVTIAGDTSGTWLTTNATGVTLTFSLGAGTDFSGTAGAWNSNNNTSATGAVSVIGTLNATWYITGVQLEVGSVATPFERRPYGTELSLCQRYCNVYGGAANFDYFGVGFVTAANAAEFPVTFPVEMRSVPTVSLKASYSFSVNDASVAVTGGTAALTAAVNNTRKIVLMNLTSLSASTLTIGRACRISSNNTTNTQMTFSSEL